MKTTITSTRHLAQLLLLGFSVWAGAHASAAAADGARLVRDVPRHATDAALIRTPGVLEIFGADNLPSSPGCRLPVLPARRLSNGGFAAPADYDGDGKFDPSVVRSDGKWAIDFSSNGFGAFDHVSDWHNGASLSLPVPGDYDGDCKADRAAKDVAGNWSIDFASDGFGSWDVAYPGYGGPEFAPVPSDYDGDGSVDFSTKDANGSWYVDWSSNGRGEPGWDAIFTGYGGPQFIPVPADYDGDGQADFSTRDGDNWYVDWSSNGRGEPAWDAIYPGFGGAGFTPVPADYDGDGKADFSSRDADGNWYIDFSVNGRAEAVWDAIHAGFESSETYAPAPADYDGDGRADIASVLAEGSWLIDYAVDGFGAWDAHVSWGPNSFGEDDQCTTDDQRVCLPLFGCFGECTVTCCQCSGDHCTCAESPCE